MNEHYTHAYELRKEKFFFFFFFFLVSVINKYTRKYNIALALASPSWHGFGFGTACGTASYDQAVREFTGQLEADTRMPLAYANDRVTSIETHTIWFQSPSPSQSPRDASLNVVYIIFIFNYIFTRLDGMIKKHIHHAHWMLL